MARRPTDFFGKWQQGRVPAIRTLLIINILTFLVVFFTQRNGFWEWTTFSSDSWTTTPWTLFTYPLIASPEIIALLFSAIWLWFIGGSLERSWGSVHFAVFFFAISAITALFFWAGASALHVDTGLLGLTMPLSAVTVAWCMLNPDQTIYFYMVIPLKARYLAWLTVALVFFLNGHGQPLFGLFALGGIATTWFYVRYLRAGVIYDGGYREPQRGRIIRIRRSALPRESARQWWNPLFWIRDWQERRRLRKLLDSDAFLRTDEDPPPADSVK